jgi:aldose 1-epimerase
VTTPRSATSATNSITGRHAAGDAASDRVAPKARAKGSQVAIELSAGDDRVVIDEAAGGRLTSLVIAGRERLVDPVDDPFQWGVFPMIPWAGRVAHARIAEPAVTLPANDGPHAIHGVTYDLRWRVDRSAGNAVELLCPLPAARWPLGGVAAQRITLGRGRLELEIQVQAGDRPMPVAVGWHPWFRRPDRGDMSVFVDSDRVLETDRERIPTGAVKSAGRKVDLRKGPQLGRRRLDHAYIDVAQPVTVGWPDLELTMELPHGASTVVVHTPERGVCVEPQTAWPNPFAAPEHSGAARLGPHEIFNAITRWTWRSR